MRIETVLGPISPEVLGITLPHGHVLETIVPILKREGISEEQMFNILIENPKRILQT